MAASDRPAATIACIDLATTARLLKSCAFANALQARTRLRWQEYRDDKLLNALYSVLWWKGTPGMAEVSVDMATVQRDTDVLFDRYSNAFFERGAAGGPGAAWAYLEQMVQLREESLASVQCLYREAVSLNRGVEETAGGGVRALAAIKASSIILVTVLGGVGGFVLKGGIAYAAAGVEIGSSVLLKVAQSREQMFGADMMAVYDADLIDGQVPQGVVDARAAFADAAKGTASDVGKEILETASEKAFDFVTNRAEISQGQMRAAQARAEKYARLLAEKQVRTLEKSGRLFKDTGRKEAEKIAQAIAKQQAATTAAKGYAATRIVAGAARYGLPILFAAQQIKEAIGEFRETAAQTR